MTHAWSKKCNFSAYPNRPEIVKRNVRIFKKSCIDTESVFKT